MTLSAFKFEIMAAEPHAPLPSKALWTSLNQDPAPQLVAKATVIDNGYEDGFRAGAQEREAELSAALAELRRAKVAIDSRADTLETHYRAKCSQTLAQIISAAAPAICEAAARAAITQIFDDAAGSAPPSLSLALSPDLHAAFGDDAGGEFAIDQDLAPGTLVARWRDGGLDCEVGRSLFAIVDFLNSQASDANEEPAS